jgi:iron complex outermembrane recepter protein
MHTKTIGTLLGCATIIFSSTVLADASVRRLNRAPEPAATGLRSGFAPTATQRLAAMAPSQVGILRVAAVMAAQDPAPAGSEQASDPGSQKAVEEVVVTAQRREERLQDVPISITVLAGGDLDKSTAQGVGEMLNRVPGVTFTAAGTGSVGGGSSLSTRGVTAPSSYVSGPSPVGYYLDTVPFGLVRSAAVPDANIYDLERVEVLRGPQGTLYGANAQAGVVRILTKDADLDAFEFKSRGLYSRTEYGGNNSQVDLAVNAPLIQGKLAARGVVGYQNLSGWIDKVTRGDVNDTEQRSARVKVGAQPSEHFSVGLSAWVSRSDYGAQPIATDGRGRMSGIADVESLATDFEVYSLKLGYDFPAFSVTSATSYLDYVNTNDFSENASRTRNLAHTVLSAYTFAQEVNLSSTDVGVWRWTAGAIYRDGLDRQFQDVAFFTYPASIKYTSKSWALFGELTRMLFDGRLEIAAGLRRFEDRVGQVQEANASDTPPPSDLAPNVQDKFHATTPRVIVNWHPNQQTTIYASYAEGFRSGLHQNPVARRLLPSVPLTMPDLLKNYEIGAKGTFLDGKLNYDTAVYYMDWRDVQLPLTVTLEGIGRSLLLNGASASGPGVDFALSTQLFDRLRIGMNLSWNDLAVDQDVYSSDIRLFDKGDRLNSSVETTVGASLSYSFPLGGGGLEGTFSATANRTTKISEKALDGTSVLARYGDPILISRASFAVDSPQGWVVTLFADNLNNEQGVTSRTTSLVPGLPCDFYLRPRTVGLQLEYRLE